MKKLRKPTENQCRRAHAALAKLIDEVVAASGADLTDRQSPLAEGEAYRTEWKIATLAGPLRMSVGFASVAQYHAYFTVFAHFEQPECGQRFGLCSSNGKCNLHEGQINDPALSPEFTVEQWKALLAPVVPAFRPLPDRCTHGGRARDAGDEIRGIAVTLDRPHNDKDLKTLIGAVLLLPCVSSVPSVVQPDAKGATGFIVLLDKALPEKEVLTTGSVIWMFKGVSDVQPCVSQRKKKS
jgi:hypothetical protein